MDIIIQIEGTLNEVLKLTGLKKEADFRDSIIEFAGEKLILINFYKDRKCHYILKYGL